MSIIANYLRVPAEKLPAITADADAFQQYIAASQGTSHTDLDQFWDALAWLASPSSREKAVLAHQWLLMAEGEFEGIPGNPSDIPADDLETAFKGGDTKLHPAIDFGYGPAAVLDVDTVHRISELLSAITHQQLVDTFEPAKMLGVHPDGWQHADSSMVHEMLLPTFDRFRKFMTAAAQGGESVVIYFN